MIGLAYTREEPTLAVLAIGLGFWVTLGAFAELVTRSGIGRVPLQTAFARLKGLPGSIWGSAFAHCGLGIMVLGIVGVLIGLVPVLIWFALLVVYVWNS